MRKIQSDTQGTYFEDDGGWRYRRLIGGVAMPARGRSGFLVVLGEDLDKDWDQQERHLRLILERNECLGRSFLDAAAVFAECSRLTREMKVYPWVGDTGPYRHDLSAHNREAYKLRQAPVQIISPPGGHGFEYYAQLVKARMLHKKTLHLDSGVVPARLSALPLDLSGEHFEDHPEASALLYAVAAAELTGKEDVRSQTPKRRASPAGY